MHKPWHKPYIAPPPAIGGSFRLLLRNLPSRVIWSGIPPLRGNFYNTHNRNIMEVTVLHVYICHSNWEAESELWLRAMVKNPVRLWGGISILFILEETDWLNWWCISRALKNGIHSGTGNWTLLLIKYMPNWDGADQGVPHHQNAEHANA